VREGSSVETAPPSCYGTERQFLIYLKFSLIKNTGNIIARPQIKTTNL